MSTVTIEREPALAPPITSIQLTDDDGDKLVLESRCSGKTSCCGVRIEINNGVPLVFLPGTKSVDDLRAFGGAVVSMANQMAGE